MNKTPTFVSSDAPELKNKTVTDVFVNEGDDVTLNCEAEGNPPPVFHWTSEGVNISETSSELNITRVNAYSTYTCTATNELGSITKQIHVHVIKSILAAAPAAMTTPEASTPRSIHPRVFYINLDMEYVSLISIMHRN